MTPGLLWRSHRVEGTGLWRRRRSALRGERAPVSSGWGLEKLSRIGGTDPCWDGDEGCFPTRVKVGAGHMTRRVLFPGPVGPRKW